jgi:pyruvate ferredoxin oxidoreductase alpha subunit
MIPAVKYIYGLGGRDLLVEHVEHIFEELVQAEQGNETNFAPRYIGVRG